MFLLFFLQQVPVVYGFLIEGVATLLCRLSSKFLSDKEPAYANIIDSFIGTSLVVAGEKLFHIFCVVLLPLCREMAYLEHSY